MLLKEEPALNFQQCFAFPACLFFPELGETCEISSSEWSSQDPMSISHAVCSAHRFEVRSWEAFGSPSFSLPLPTGIWLSGSKILLAIFKAST